MEYLTTNELERDGAEVDEGALDDEGVEVGTAVEGKDEGALDE